MPRIIETWFDERFASQRTGLVETVRQHLPRQQPGLEAVGTWLDTDYSEPKVRGILERRRQEYRLRDAAQPTPPDGRRIPGSGYRDPVLPGDGLRADRLEQAFSALRGQNQGGDLLRLLGQNLPRKERETHALRAVVVSACIVDPDAGEWLADTTPLAESPWRSDASASPPVKGRADVARVWANEALRLLQEACNVLGWEPAADSDARPEADAPVTTAAAETDWRDVQRRLLEMCDKDKPYTNLRDLMKQTECGSISTVSKAIKRSTALIAWKARHTKAKGSPRASSLTEVHLDNTAQTCEVDPAEAASLDDPEEILAHLIQDAEPKVRAKLNAISAEDVRNMTGDQVRQLAEMITNDPDNYNRVFGRRP